MLFCSIALTVAQNKGADVEPKGALEAFSVRKERSKETRLQTA